MCMICAALRPYEDDCAYGDAAASNTDQTLTRTEITDALHFDLSLLTDQRLNGAEDPAYVFTYQFDDTESATLPTGLDFDGWTAWSNADRSAMRDVLEHIETIANVSFVEVSGDADPDINLGLVDVPDPFTGYGGYSYRASGGQLTDYDSYAVFDTTRDIPNSVNLLLHEMGHALGLSHPFGHGDALPAAYDTNRYTVMSYDANPDNGQDSDALQIFDILALQARWGANSDYNTGNDRYTGARNNTVDAIWDAGGTDWLDARGRNNDVVLDLREAAFSSFDTLRDVAIAYDAEIEHARGGTGDDRLIGNDLGNKLIGLGGADDLTGRKGADTLKGGGGRDTLTGGQGGDTLIGGLGRDRLEGGKGADTLKGGGGADRFVFTDGDGRDTIRDFADDVDVLRLSIDGIDTVADAMAEASNRNGHVVFEFANGLELTLRNITKAELRDDIELF